MFDIDKIFIASLNYKMTKTKDGWTATDQFPEGSKQQVQNQLLERYITLLTDDEGMHVANRSIDNDTQLILDVLEDLESGKSSNKEFEPVDPYDFYTLSKHTSTKLNFLTGKSGIGPFALNNNSQILTTLYEVEFSDASFMKKLERVSLHDKDDMDGQSIMSWISALINAHVDIAKDPYISRLNVNQMTYNLVNLMIRTGYGKRTFYFTKQPVMLSMANRYNQAQGSFMQDTQRSKWEIRNQAKQDGVIDLVGKPTFDQITQFLGVSDKKPTGSIDKFAKSLLESDVLHDIARGDISITSTQTYNIGGFMFTPAQIQVLVYYTDKALETPAQAISDLVKYSKIDTKKQGKNVSEQLAYLKGVAKTFNDPFITSGLFGNTNVALMTDEASLEEYELNVKEEKLRERISLLKNQLNNATTEEEKTSIQDDLNDAEGEHMYVIGELQDVNNDESKRSEFSRSIQRMYRESFIEHKTKAAVRQFMSVMDGQVFEATPGFQNLIDRLCSYFGKNDASSISEIVQAVTAKIKANAINDYADKMGIDIHGLVSGNNTIYDRLNSIKVRLKSDPAYQDVANNPLLNLLIADKNWKYEYAKHTGNMMDRFLSLKFIRLFDALDKSSSKTDYIISAWDQLLKSNNHPEIREFARDLCVYAYVTSGDKGGRTKLFNYVPNSFREESGYVKYVENELEKMKRAEDYGSHMFTDELIDDIVLNNQNSNTFVKTIDVSNKNWKEGMTKWKGITVNQQMHVGYDQNGNPIQYKPSYPIFVTSDTSTPVDITTLSPFIKISHMSRSKTDNSSRAESVYKLIAFVPTEKGKGYPLYVKTNTKGYHIGRGYDFYEYGRNVYDAEYVPNIATINSYLAQIVSNKQAWDAKYGNGFADAMEILRDSIEQPVGYRQTSSYTPNQRRVVTVPDAVKQVEQKAVKELTTDETKIDINAGTRQLVKKELPSTLGSKYSNYKVSTDSEGSIIVTLPNFKGGRPDAWKKTPDGKYYTQIWLEGKGSDEHHIEWESKWVDTYPGQQGFPKFVSDFLDKHTSTQELLSYDALIEYTPTGKEKQTYYIKGAHIYNKNGKEVFASESVDRTKIFANLAIKQGRAVVVDYRGSKYVVNNKNVIVSVQTGKIMKWGEENGDRNNILGLAKPKLESVARLMNESKKGESNENLKC